MESIQAQSFQTHSHTLDLHKLRLESHVGRAAIQSPQVPKQTLWAREFVSLLQKKLEPNLKKQLLKFCAIQFNKYSTSPPSTCLIREHTSSTRSITILGVSHIRSLNQKSADHAVELLTWIQAMVTKIKPNAIFLEAGLGNPTLSPEQKTTDPLRYETSLQNLRLNPHSAHSEMYFAARRALAENPACEVYNMEPRSIAEELMKNTNNWIDNETDFSPAEFITASRSAAMIHFFLGTGKYEGRSVNDLLDYISSKDVNPHEKWETSFEIMKRYIPQFSEIISDPERHKESAFFSAPSAHVKRPTILNRISDISCNLREKYWKKVIDKHSRASNLVLCGSGHTETFSQLFENQI